MKCFAVQSKLVGMTALLLVSLPLFAQAPPHLALPDAAPALTPGAIDPLPLPAGDLPALNLPTVTPPDAASAVVAPAPASALPAVTATPSASAPATNDLPASSAVADNAVSTPKTYSFGDSELSILFLPDQVSRMKEAIRTFEDTGKDAEKPAPLPEVVAAPVAPEIIEDPLSYPVFYLSTIVYKGAGDWSLWLSGYKITSQRNYTDVTVLNVTRDSATFLWKPSFMKAISKRQQEKRFAPTDSVKHKFVATQSVSLDSAANAIVFTLKPNQSFAPGYFKTFEGYIDGPTLTALPVVVAAGANVGQSMPNQPSFGQPMGNARDANGNPVDEGQNFNDGANSGMPSTNFNPPAR